MTAYPPPPLRPRSLALVALVVGFGVSCTPKATLAPETAATTPPAPASTTGTAPSRAPDSPLPFDPDVRRGVLANGLTYYVRANARPSERAELRLVVKAGSILEDDDQRGLAHFVEHMAFNGTENYAENDLIDYLQSTGARFGPDLNAYTSFDETVYLLQVRTDSAELLDKGLGILRDWAGGITFADAEIDKERGVVLSEWRSGLGAQERLRNETLPVVLANSRYAERLPIGDTTVLKRAPYDALKRYYRDWYRPDLMAVAAVGDFDPAAVEADIRRRFGDLDNPPSPRAREPYPGPAYTRTQAVVATDPEANYTLVQLNYLLPERKTRTEAEFREGLVAGLYNAMLAARFAEKAEDPTTPYSFAGSGRSGLVGSVDSYSAYALAKPGQALASLRAVVTENRRVREHGFTAGELARAKASLLNDLRTAAREAATTPSGRRATGLVAAFLDGEPLTDAATDLELGETYVPSIALAEVNALAEVYLAERPLAAVITGSTEDALPDEAAVLSAIRGASARPTEPYVDQGAASLEVPTLRPVDVETVERYDSADVTVVTLGNGVRVAYKTTDFADNEILLAGVSKGGSNQFADADFPTADMAGAIGSAMGTGPFTPSALERALAGKTVSLRAGIASDEEVLSGQATPETLEDLMRLVYLHFTGPTYDEALGRAMLDQQRAFIANLAANPNFRFQVAVNEALYGKDNPRRQPPSPEQLDAVDLARGYALYRERFADARDWQFNFVGDFDPDTLVALASRYLGNLPSRGGADAYRDPGDRRATGSIERRFQAGQAPRSNVLLLRAGPLADDDRERLLFQTTVDVLSEQLRERLREDLGGVYGVRVSGQTNVRPVREYVLQVTFNADPPRVDELLAATQAVIDSIVAVGPDAETLGNVRTTQYEGMKTAMGNSNRFWLTPMQRAYTEGYDIDHASAERLRRLQATITAADVQAALRRYFETAAVTKLRVVMDPEG